MSRPITNAGHHLNLVQSIGGCVLLLVVLCSGCATVTEWDTPLLPSRDQPLMLPEIVDQAPLESNPTWATESPRLDLIGECPTDLPETDECAPIFLVPQSEAPGPEFEFSDLPTQTSCRGCPACRPNPDKPWGRPKDEYICDGGDAGIRVRVRNNWQIDGLQMEDTIAHFDTLAGDVGIVQSNRACIYSPRFAAVRSVHRAFQRQVNEVAVDARKLATPQYRQIGLVANSVKQPIATVRAVGTSIGTTFEKIEKGLLVENVQRPLQARDQWLPFENLQIIEYGVLARSDVPTLMEGVAAARLWSAVEMAQVVIDHELAFEQKGVGQAQAEVVYESPRGKPRLRLVKLASKCDAKAGDVVDFTIRFDNVGDLLIGNVTIVDKLTTRLNYVDESESCTVDGSFDHDTADAVVLRWEIDEPLKPGEGGVIRFQCKVQ